MSVSTIKTIIWDFDKTLYHNIPELDREIKASEITVIQNHTGWDKDKAKAELSGIYGTKFYSDTAASAYLCGITVPQAAIEMETYFDRTKFVKRDEKLIDLFKRLSTFDHYILGNGAKNNIRKTLIALGLTPETFKEIVTSEDTGVNKPDKQGFIYIMNKTKQPPETHMMVGDRDRVDIAPAKSLGMQTCYVWGVCPIADYSVPTVYDVASILT